MRNGYIFLLTVLFVGILAFSAIGAFLILSTASLQSGLTLQQSSQALGLAETCVERALRDLQKDSGYSGEESVDLLEGSCEILAIGGTGNNNRTVCAEGTAGKSTRRLEILVAQLIPAVTISSWQEVGFFTACAE